MTPRFGQVALPLPLAQPYTYRIPETIADRVEPGARVVVPVRERELVGIVVGVGVDAPEREAKDIRSAPDPEPVFPPPLLEAATWVSRYYGAPLGLAIRAALPAVLWGESRIIAALAAPTDTGGLAGEVLRWLEKKGGEAPVPSVARGLKRPVWDAVNRLVRVGAVTLRVEPAVTDAGVSTERIAALTGTRLTLLEREALFKRAPAQRAVLEALEAAGGRAPTRHLTDQLKLSAAGIRGLAGRGLVELEDVPRLRDPFAGLPGSPPPPTLTAQQLEAVAALASVPAGEGSLLFGVTGSGKTLVYLETIRREIDQGRGAIILVPEIGLTPQTVSRVRGLFGDQVAVLHSGLSEGERADAWRALRSGVRRVAVGARSAVFAPVQNLGVIVVDEEHDASYKNSEAPRYHARDVAMVRARLEGARLVLGSATPSPESMARTGPRLRLVRLPDRIGNRPLPPVELVDLRSAPRLAIAGAVPWSERLDGAVSGALEREEQIILLLNRRGFAAFLQCLSCGEVRGCPRCSIALTVHQAPPRLRCHYCAHEEPIPPACPACGHAVQRARGVGTQQVERFLTERFPRARLSRMDLDTTSTKWSHHRILEAFGQGAADILVGTQMIAKGLDFPGVTLVGVVDADTGLHLPDFRAAERTFQLLAQVAGRAGRGPRGGRVIVQTRNPEHHALVSAAQHDTEGFLATELALRKDPPYPPEVALVNLVSSGPNEAAVGRVAAAVADWCRGLAERHRLGITILGPAPAALARIQDRWRWHVVLKGTAEELGRVVRYGATRLPGAAGVRTIIDRDPVSLL
jgi:primosomal protein N' (replication factor Y) (superfamily II helicase)